LQYSYFPDKLFAILRSSVGIVLGYGLDDRGSTVRSLAGAGNFFFFFLPPRPERLWGSPDLLSAVPGAFSLGIKRPGREADHSPPSSAKSKCVELYLHSSNTPSWRGADLKN
jgi:hypothetical protein